MEKTTGRGDSQARQPPAGIPGAQMPFRFDGGTYDPAKDQRRLSGQVLRVFEAMSSGQWMTLAELEWVTKDPQASVSARLRDLRKARFGGHRVERRRAEGGLWEYRLTVSEAEDA